jgi:restriction endonuclease S subunit
MAVWSIVKVSELEGAKRLDAEYYRPEYLKVADKLHDRGAAHLGDLLSDIRYGIYTEPDYLKEGTDFIRALNLEELDIQGEVLKVRSGVIPSARYLLKPGDVLIVRSGANVGNAGIIIDRLSGATFGSYTIRLRFKPPINPYIVYVFLKSKFGRLQTVRFRTGLAQPNINIPNLRLLQIVDQFPTVEQEKIERLVKQLHREIIQSESLYLQAEQMVLEEIRWDKLDLSQPKWYTVPLSRVQEVQRLDAEHFQPKYDKLIAHLKKTGKVKQIRDLLAEPIQKGVTPDYDPDGSIVAINSQHLGRYCLNFEATDRTTQEFRKANRRAQIHQNDVMIYATGAYIGRANAYLETARALAGVDILLVRPTEECNPFYLAVFLNAPPGLMQSKRFASGSGQAHIYPEDVASYWIYIPSEKFQQKVADLVQKSYEARQKAKALLEEAKVKVEALIG